MGLKVEFNEPWISLRLKICAMEIMVIFLVFHAMTNVVMQWSEAWHAISLDWKSANFNAEIVAHARFYS